MTLSIASFTRATTKTVAGNYDRLFVAKKDDIESVTFTTEEVTAIAMEDGMDFADLEADLDSVQFTTSGEGGRGYFSEQNMIAKFSQKTLAMETLVSELINGAISGLVCIRIDRNGHGWISGIAPAESELKNMPYLKVTEAFDSGENIEAVDEGNRYTLTFTRMSATREYHIDAATTATILAGTDDFIDGHSST
jgi:hypothetical protein